MPDQVSKLEMSCEQYSKLDKYLRQLGKRFFSKLTT